MARDPGGRSWVRSRAKETSTRHSRPCILVAPPGRLPRARSSAMDVSSTCQPAVRNVDIAPPSARTETWNVLRAAALIVLATWIYIADTAAPAGSGAGTLGGTGEVG